MIDNLKERQKAAHEVETKMVEALLGFIPAQDLKVVDVLFIARHAGAIAFDAFDPARAKLVEK